MHVLRMIDENDLTPCPERSSVFAHGINRFKMAACYKSYRLIFTSF